MKLIVGLGNPGKKYEGTRHNMGFMAIDLLSDQAQIDVDKEVFHGLMGRGKIFNEDVILFKPTTFMNLSGPLRKMTYEISQLRIKAHDLNQKHREWKEEHAAELPDPEKDPAYLEIIERRRRYAEAIPGLLF